MPPDAAAVVAYDDAQLWSAIHGLIAAVVLFGVWTAFLTVAIFRDAMAWDQIKAELTTIKGRLQAVETELLNQSIMGGDSQSRSRAGYPAANFTAEGGFQ